MTKITLHHLLSWILSGGLIGYGLSLMPLPPMGVAMIAAGAAGLFITARAINFGIALLAAIVAISPHIIPNWPAWAPMLASAVILLVIVDQIIRSNWS